MGGCTKVLFAVAIVGLTAAAAQAGTITQYVPFGPATPNFDQTLTFNQFNGPLADLLSIQVELGLHIDGGYLIVDNDGTLPATVTVQLGATGAISSTDVPLIDLAWQPVVAPVSVFSGNTFNLAPDNGDGPMNVDPNPPDGATHYGIPGSNSGAGFINPALFGSYVGAGTFNIKADVSQILDFGSVGGVEGAYGPVLADGYARVIYNFVPEPATVLVLIIGAATAIRRRL